MSISKKQSNELKEVNRRIKYLEGCVDYLKGKLNQDLEDYFCERCKEVTMHIAWRSSLDWDRVNTDCCFCGKNKYDETSAHQFCRTNPLTEKQIKKFDKLVKEVSKSIKEKK